MSDSNAPIAVLFSGNGTNMQSVIKHAQQGRIRARIACVISNRADAYGLTRANNAGIPSHVVPHDQFASRELFEAELIRILESYEIETVVLAGFMRVFSEVFINRYANRILNIHPSLLPKYPGLGTHHRVLKAQESQHGCSVHFVTVGLDEGPLVLQAKVPVFETDDVHSLIRRVLEKEHIVFPLAIRWFCEGKLYCNDGTVYFNEKKLERPLQLTIAHKTELV
ncbi:MAG: phosphoribosylglycinamide formyltransferase [Gammaproteobacteria bacterium]|nr:phosphoribosylglycinamide formyltransferase [Gammaproteobacteria bacterium]